MTQTRSGLFFFLLMLSSAATSAGEAEDVTTASEEITTLVPGAVSTPRPGGGARVVGVDVRVEVRGGDAFTSMTVTVRNDGAADAAARLIVPVPRGAVAAAVAIPSRVEAVVAASIAEGAEASGWLERLVAKSRDPSLLEFAAETLVRTGAFSIGAGESLDVVVRFRNRVPYAGGRSEVVIRRTVSLADTTPWRVEFDLGDDRGILALYSPSHAVAVDGRTPTTARVIISSASLREPGPVRLSWSGAGMGATTFTSPDEDGAGGHFLFVGEPVAIADDVVRKREVTVVVDRSGSMRGAKIEQAREAALQIVHGLATGESFNLVIYNEAVETFAPAPVVKSAATAKAAEAWLAGLAARGGTNLHGALKCALESEPTAGTLPLVIFLTDGRPTSGITGETAIRDLAESSNPHRRRVFTFGVGVDVNTALLSAIATASRARPTFVLPGADVETAVAALFGGLLGPVMTSPVLEARSITGAVAVGRIRDVVPGTLPDYYRGDTVIIAGRYTGSEPLVLRVRGRDGEQTLDAALQHADDRGEYAFVKRIWASRRIAELVAAVRRTGAEGGRDAAATAEAAAEIVALATEFGIITEYTEFLSSESCDLSDAGANVAAAATNLTTKAQGIRWGSAAVNQDLNNNSMICQSIENRRNGYVSSDLARKEIGGVQQIGGRAFFRRGSRWVDGRARDAKKPDIVITFGSPKYLELSRRLREDGRHVLLAVKGELMLEIDGKMILIKP